MDFPKVRNEYYEKHSGFTFVFMAYRTMSEVEMAQEALGYMRSMPRKRFVHGGCEIIYTTIGARD